MSVFVEVNPDDGDPPTYITRASGGKNVVAHIYPPSAEEQEERFDTEPRELAHRREREMAERRYQHRLGAWLAAKHELEMVKAIMRLFV